MGESKRIGKQVAEELAEGGAHAITPSRARELVRNTGDIDSPWMHHVAAGFQLADWSTSDGLYYLPEKLSEKTAEFSQKLRTEGRPVVSQSVVAQAVTGMDYPRGEWGELLYNAMEAEGWQVDDENGLYYLPMDELVTESSLAHYVFGSFSLGDAGSEESS